MRSASGSLITRGGCGSTILPPASFGPSAPNATSNSSSAPASARVVCASERLKISTGVSRAATSVCPANFAPPQGLSGPRERRRRTSALQSAQGRLPSSHLHPRRRFRQIGAEGALVEFRHCRALQLIALVQERHPEGEADIAEDFGILRPKDH